MADENGKMSPLLEVSPLNIISPDFNRLVLPQLPSDSGSNEISEAAKILVTLLEQNGGQVSTRKLKSELQEKGLHDPEHMIILLKESPIDKASGVTWKTWGKSFFTPEHLEKTLEAAEQYETAETLEAEGDLEEDCKVQKPKNHEARLCRYIRDFLQDIYDSEWYPFGDGEEIHYAFDVHSLKPSGVYSNVDLLAFDWRSKDIVEVVTVEAKLEFNAEVVEQARNYARFSDRVWIAIVVDCELDEAGKNLKWSDANSLLLDHVIEQGIGIMACRKSHGGSFKVAPVHWPKAQHPSLLEREKFIEAYKRQFVEARIVPEKEVLKVRFAG